MCWTRWYDGTHNCIGRLGRFGPCSGTSVVHHIEENGIYSYDSHVCYFKQYISSYCPDCGQKWVEFPKNWEEIQEKHGVDVDWVSLMKRRKNCG